MATRARDVMTEKPGCCTPDTLLEQVAKLMVQHDCGEIPVVDSADRVVGVITDRDIVCRVVASGKNPLTTRAEACMSQLVVTVPMDASLEEVLTTMEKHQIGGMAGRYRRAVCRTLSQSDLAWAGDEHDVAELVREVSRDTGQISR